MQMQASSNEIKGAFLSRESGFAIFASAVLLFSPFFIFRISWGIDNQHQSLFTHIPQAVAIAAICIVSFRQLRANRRQVAIVSIFSGLLLIHLAQTNILIGSLRGYSNDYFLQGILLWAYLFAVCLYASNIKVDSYQRLLRYFDIFAKSAVFAAIAFYFLYKLTGIAVLVHFYDGFGLARLQGFFSEPSALAPVTCWLLLTGVRYRRVMSVGLALIVCALSFSPIVIISTLLALATYLMIFHARTRPIILIVGILATAWIATIDCSISSGGSSIFRSACGIKSIFSADARDIFINDRLLSSIAIFQHLSATDSWMHGLGINSTSVFMPTYFGVMRDNSLLISVIAFYGVAGVSVFFVFVCACIIKAWRLKNILSIFWLSFFWCSMINSAQGFITYALLFVASIWLMYCPAKINHSN